MKNVKKSKRCDCNICERCELRKDPITLSAVEFARMIKRQQGIVRDDVGLANKVCKWLETMIAQPPSWQRGTVLKRLRKTVSVLKREDTKRMWDFMRED